MKGNSEISSQFSFKILKETTHMTTTTLRVSDSAPGLGIYVYFSVTPPIKILLLSL